MTETQMVLCPTCEGSKTRFAHRTPGVFMKCPKCNGTAEVPACNCEDYPRWIRVGCPQHAPFQPDSTD